MADSKPLPTASVVPPRRHCILGTAGHIDHGKSSLVKALTGTDPDRLPEEQARGMTIELGYAHLDLHDPAGGDPLSVGIVDVPGHERFVRTMVAGATGVDLAMLVVAADDGVMPQTREHVDILDLLGIQCGLVALSKIDLAHPDRVQLVRRQIAQVVAGTPLSSWPVVACSAKTGQGLDEIRATIAALMTSLAKPAESPVFRLAIDRVFAIHGRGTVVTGSVLAGSVTPGATLELLPSGLSCKVREVQSYGAAVRAAGTGQRAALNLTGADREQIDRGMELATPGYLTASRHVDARLRLLARRERPLESHQRVRVCMGTTEEMATAVLVGAERIDPGGEGPAQLRFARPVVCDHGQRFILRNETAQATIGGGTVIRPVSRRIRPKNEEEREALLRAEAADPLVRCEEALRWAGFEARSAIRLSCEVGIPAAEIGAIRDRLRKAGRLVTLGSGPGGRSEPEVHADTLAAAEERALAFLRRHHAGSPTEPGLLRDRYIGWLEKRTAAGCGRVLFERLEKAGKIVSRGPYVAQRDFRPALSPEDADLLEKLVAEITAAKFDPPVWTALKTVAGLSRQRSRVLEDIAKTEPRLTAFAPQQYICGAALEEIKAAVRRLGAGRSFRLAEVRDALNLSRRVVQPLLEHLDRVGFTKRVGDERVLVEGKK